ncbi:MAG: hypothetical protein ACK4N1_02675 [Pseudorhizobium sp.]
MSENDFTLYEVIHMGSFRWRLQKSLHGLTTAVEDMHNFNDVDAAVRELEAQGFTVKMDGR